MNILTSYTRRCLRRNRMRTLVTIIGIVLSVALFTAVAEGTWSGWRYLIRATEAEKGRYHAVFRELSEDEYASLARDPQVAELGRLETLGWAEIAPEALDWPYLRVASYDFSCDLLSVRMIAGRWPQNDHELIVSNQMPSLSKVSYTIGQTVSLELGQRAAEDGTPLPIYTRYQIGAWGGSAERLRDTVSHEYTIVGVFHYIGGALSDYDCAGTLALTTASPPRRSCGSGTSGTSRPSATPIPTWVRAARGMGYSCRSAASWKKRTCGSSSSACWRSSSG